MWSALAALLAGEIVYLIVGERSTIPGWLLGLAAAAVIGLLFIRTTDGRQSDQV
jgi:hypothetical protein